MNRGEKTRDELFTELQSLKKQFEVYKKTVSDKMEFELNERLKELNCHNRISKVMSNPDLSVKEVINEIARIIPPGWQFPELAEAMVKLGSLTCQTPGFDKAAYLLQENILVDGRVAGVVKVGYPENKLLADTKVFLPEESDLLLTIAERLGNYLGKVEKKLAYQESENKYRNLIENINDVIYEISPTGTITYISPSVEKIVGFTAGEIIGKNYSHFVGENADILRQRLSELKIKNQIENEYKITAKSGKICWVRLSTKAVFKNGEYIGGNGTVIDITEKVLAEERIKQQNERLSAIVSAIPDLLFIVDKNGIALEHFTNDSSKLLAPEDQLNGINIIKLFNEETGNLHLEKIAECIESKKMVAYEYSIPEGNVFNHFEARLLPLSDYKVFAFIRDFTEKKIKEDELRKLSLALEQSPVSVLITDLKANIEYVNATFLTTTGYSYSEVIGKNTRMLKSGKTGDKVYKDLWETITKGKEWQGECVNKKKNGSLFWEHINITPIHDDNGQITNFLAVKQDITQRKHAEKEIRELNANLEHKIAERTNQLVETNDNLLHEIEVRKLAEDALWAKSAELENFFSVALDLLCIVEQSGRFIKVNKAWEGTLGYPAGELENMNLLTFVHPDDMEPTLDVIAKLSEQHPVFEFTNRLRTKEGKYRYIEWHNTPVGGTIYAAARDITERKRNEDFENELLRLSSKLTGIPASEINNALLFALSQIGKFLGADRSYTFEFDEDGLSMSNTHEWCNAGIEPQAANLQNIPSNILPAWMEILQRQENILIPSVAGLPEKWKAEREILESQNIKSLIAIPMLAENKLIGFVSLDSVLHHKEYTAAEINILNVWCRMLASLINNQRAEKLLEQTRQNYETFFNTIDDFLWVLDYEGQIIHVNKSVKIRLGYTSDQLTGQSILSIYPNDRQDEAAKAVSEMLVGNTDYCLIPVVTTDGRQIPVETHAKKGQWNGHPVIFGVSKDISQIKLSEEKFSTAFHSNSAMMAISYFDDGRYVDVNNAFTEALGYSHEELVGRTNKELGLFVDQNLRSRIIGSLKNNNPVKKMEILMRTNGGVIKTGLLSADSIYIGDKQCLLTVTIDISERKKAEEETKKAHIEAERANMAKSEFLSRMSHELRTPLNSILGFSQLLEMGELNLSQKKGVTHILKSGKHLLDLINEILDISRIESGRLSLSLEPVQLSGVIEEMMDTAMPIAGIRNIELLLKDSPCNKMFIKSDRQRFKQIILNLINNAIKYNHEGGKVTITTELLKKGSNNEGNIKISVIDTGFGIPPEDLSKIFTPYERIGADRTNTEGTGLGLSVVKKLVDAMGGEIGVESIINKGSNFWVIFPSAESQVEVIKQSGALTALKKGLVQRTGTILYIEDNVPNVELVGQILSEERPGMRLIANSRGKQAVRLATKYGPNLILLDLNLPDIHGSEVLKMLLSDDRTKSIPVVIISADAMPGQLEKLLKAGAKKYLTKPLDIRLFLKVIDEYLEG